MGTKKRVTPSRTVSLADALFTKVQQRVLAVLFGNPARSFYANEIISLAGSGIGAVQRELIRLEAAELVTVKRVGKQKHYQANTAAPIYEELHGLVVKTFGLADVLRTALKPLAKKIDAAFVYGSVAKSGDTATSDIDLMIISDKLTYPDLYRVLEDLAKQLGRAVSPTVYSRQELAKRVRTENAFVTRVLAQPKIWLIGEEGALGAR